MRQRILICIVIIALFGYQAAAARQDAAAQRRAVYARDTFIEAQAAAMATQAREMRNLQGVIRDQAATIEHIFGRRPEQPSRGHAANAWGGHTTEGVVLR